MGIVNIDQSSSFIRIEFTEYTITLNVLRGKFHDVKKKPVHYTFNELRMKIAQTPRNRVDFKVLLFEKHSRFSMAFASIVFSPIILPVFSPISIVFSIDLSIISEIGLSSTKNPIFKAVPTIL